MSYPESLLYAYNKCLYSHLRWFSELYVTATFFPSKLNKVPPFIFLIKHPVFVLDFCHTVHRLGFPFTFMTLSRWNNLYKRD